MIVDIYMAGKTKKNVRSKKKNKVKAQPVGKAYVFSGYNNTIVTITNMSGDTVCWSSGGNIGFKGSRKSTPYAATMVGEDAAKKAVRVGIKEVSAYIRGVGSGKSQSVKALRNGGLFISKIVDVTPMPHGGCRPKKRRRV